MHKLGVKVPSSQGGSLGSITDFGSLPCISSPQGYLLGPFYVSLGIFPTTKLDVHTWWKNSIVWLFPACVQCKQESGEIETCLLAMY